MPASLLESTAIVTVTYNSSNHLGAFLESVRASEAENVAVLVADNDSHDIDATEATAERFGAEVVRVGENRGYGGAVNVAVRMLNPEFRFVLISNPDVRMNPGALEGLVEELDARPEAASIGPRVLNEDGTTYPSARNLPSLRNGIGHALFSRTWPENPWSRSYRAENRPSNVSRVVGWLSGSYLLVRRSAFDAVGGFDEGFFMYFEDVDLGRRFGAAGWQNVYAPHVSVVHSGAHSTATESARMLQAHHGSAARYLARRYPKWYMAPLRWVLDAGLSIRWRLIARPSRRG